jgi:hypothetical protein
VAFRPTIARSLVLSVMLVLIFLISKAISMPKGIGCLNPLIFKDLFDIWNFNKRKIVTFFVSKNRYLLNHHQLERP